MLLMLAGFVILKLVIAGKFAFLNLYFIPVLLAGYYLGKRPAILTGLASVLLMAIFFIRWPAELTAQNNGAFNTALDLLVWGCLLMLVTIMVSTINENRQRRGALATLELLERYLRRATDTDGSESHVARVASLAMAIAKEMRMPADFLTGIEAAGLIHDMGDTAEGLDIVETSSVLSSKNPESLAGTALPILIARDKRRAAPNTETALQSSARILALADMYDDITVSAEAEPMAALKLIEHEGTFDKLMLNALKHVVQRRLSLGSRLRPDGPGFDVDGGA